MTGLWRFVNTRLKPREDPSVSLLAVSTLGLAAATPLAGAHYEAISNSSVPPCSSSLCRTQVRSRGVPFSHTLFTCERFGP